MDLPEFEDFDYDISFVTDGFTVNSDHRLQVTDPGQRPIIVKREQIWESKDTEAALKELQMVQGFTSNQQLRQPTLQDAVVNPENLLTSIISEDQNTDVLDTLSCIPSVDTLGNNELHQVIHRMTNENFVEIQALPSDKKKNPPYLVEGKDITTLNRTPVTIIVSGVKQGYAIHVSLRYVDEIAKNKAVNPCKNHQDWNERPTNLPNDFNFCLMKECKYERRRNHPTAIIDIQESLIDTNGIVRFSIVFLCLNSCQKENGKKMDAVITVIDPHSNLVLGEECFSLRICMNVKRDHKEKNELSLKRKHSGQEKYAEEPLKAQKVEDTAFQNVAHEATHKNQEPTNYMFQMMSKKQENLILGLIEELGGKWYEIKEISKSMPLQ